MKESTGRRIVGDVSLILIVMMILLACCVGGCCVSVEPAVVAITEHKILALY
jgi:hypothetical protein